MNFRTLIHSLRAPALGSAIAVMIGSPLLAQSVDPDPDLFDGTRTKKEQIKQDKGQQTDQWQEANLILYDSKEQGSAEGGQGRTGLEGPGFADGAQAEAGGMQAGIPMPMGGGSGSPSTQPTIPGMPPMGSSSTPTAAGAPSQAGGAPDGGPPGKPGEVAIGDPNQQISPAAKNVAKVGNGAPPPTGEETQESKGEDTTNVPKSASGQQSGKRGGGVEKGDAMPTDI